MAPLRILAVAVVSQRIAYVFMVGADLIHWRITERAAQCPVEAAGALQRWINDLRPHVVVTEKLTPLCRKGSRSQEIIRALTSITSNNYLLDVAINPEPIFGTKFEEACELIARYPDLSRWRPKKRRAFDNAPRNTVLFDALRLADEVITKYPGPLIAAMDTQ